VGDRETARRLAEQAAQFAPDLEEPWLILAAISNPQESVDCLRRALQINPSSLRARDGMHWAVQRLRKHQIFVQLPVSSTKPPIELREPTELSITGTEFKIRRVRYTIVAPMKYSCLPVHFTGIQICSCQGNYLILTVAVGLYLFILILNLGGCR
jgi:hypothetical protein